jgi:fatty-acyl-CoA synthase
LADPVNQEMQSAKLPRLKRVVLIGDQSKPGVLPFAQVMALAEQVSDEELKTRQAGVSPHDVVQMQYTSGTTGFPKAVMLTHYNLINQSLVACARGDLRADERYVTAMPFFHIAGSLGAIVYSLYLGCTLIPMITFDPLNSLPCSRLSVARSPSPYRQCCGAAQSSAFCRIRPCCAAHPLYRCDACASRFDGTG